MAVPKDKKVLSVTLKRDLYDKLDAYCKGLGISKSNYIAYVIAQNLDVTQKTTDKLTDAVAQVLNNAIGESAR